jgi:phosphomevalonate kinase
MAATKKKSVSYHTMTISASAPGKVLICGGYLVVEAPHVGLSIGVSARFTTRVVTCEQDPNAKTLTVGILSPQFHTSFEFVVSHEGGATSVEQSTGPKSPFLFYGILYAASCAAALSGSIFTGTLTLELLASNDFYSQRNFLESRGETVTAATLRTVPAHQPLVGEVSKTGLGSSAAMTTSFVACLMKCFGVSDDVERIHRVAQVAHSVAQGKIGSGFDVFTAAYGTSIYRRFPAAFAEQMMRGEEPPKSVVDAELATCIRPERVWVEPIRFRGLPRGIHLILGDIHQGGSSTPGMVSKVMAWRKSVKGHPDNLWDQLAAANVNYVTKLQQLCEPAESDPLSHDAAVRELSTVSLSTVGVSSGSTTAAEHILEAMRAAGACRSLLREIGNVAEVTIEPKELTPLLDATAQLPGVFAVGCPGAGGFDAIFALVLGDEGCERIEKFWESYPGMDVCPLLVREDPAGGLCIS